MTTDKVDRPSGHEIILPAHMEISHLKNVEHEHLRLIWNSDREFSLFRTDKGIDLIGGDGEAPGFNSLRYSEKHADVLTNCHSHFSIGLENSNPETEVVDCFSLYDWLIPIGKNVSNVSLIFKNGGVNLHFNDIPKDEKESESRLQSIITKYLTSKEASNKYKVPNTKRQSWLMYDVGDFRELNIANEYNIQKDLLEFASKQYGVTFRRYDLSDRGSKDTRDFLTLFNNDE